MKPKHTASTSKSISKSTKSKHKLKKVIKSSRKAWNSENARLALEAIGEGLSVNSAAKKWAIPRTTLRDLQKGLYTPDSRPGPSPVLTDDEELLVCEWIVEMARRGIPLVLNNLLDSIQHIIQSDTRPNPFKDGRPGIAWFRAFLRRHPNIAQRNAESICRARGALTEGCIRGWFSDALQYFTDSNRDYILNEPTRQYNGDETGFQLDPKTTKILGPVGETVYTESGANREQVTVLITTRGDGHVCTSAIVYPYKRAIPKPIIDKIPASFCAARSDSGWMTSEVFFEFMGNTFIPELAEYRRKQKGLADHETLMLDEHDWVVYWVDGYKSHLTIHTSKLCEINKIVLYCFKAHASHVCQPNDVGPFKPLKQEWRRAVSQWRMDHPYEVLTRVSFAAVLGGALQQLNPDAVKSGYRATGLCPFNPEAVHYERLTSTNSRKYDERAFPQKSDSQNFDEDCKVAVRCVEAILGSDLVAFYHSLNSEQFIPEEMLPPVNAYLVWKVLKLNAEKPNEEQFQQHILTVSDNNLSLENVGDASGHIQTSIDLDTQQLGVDQQLQISLDNLIVDCVAPTESRAEIETNNRQPITENFDAVNVATELSRDNTVPSAQQSLLNLTLVNIADDKLSSSVIRVVQQNSPASIDTDVMPSAVVPPQSSADHVVVGVGVTEPSLSVITSLVEKSSTDVDDIGVTLNKLGPITSPSKHSLANLDVNSIIVTEPSQADITLSTKLSSADFVDAGIAVKESSSITSCLNQSSSDINFDSVEPSQSIFNFITSSMKPSSDVAKANVVCGSSSTPASDPHREVSRPNYFYIRLSCNNVI